jgi:hypothetical protein
VEGGYVRLGMQRQSGGRAGCGKRLLATAKPSEVYFGKLGAFGLARVPRVRPLCRCRPFLWYFLLGVQKKVQREKAAEAVKVSRVISIEYLIKQKYPPLDYCAEKVSPDNREHSDFEENARNLHLCLPHEPMN